MGGFYRTTRNYDLLGYSDLPELAVLQSNNNIVLHMVSLKIVTYYGTHLIVFNADNFPILGDHFCAEGVHRNMEILAVSNRAQKRRGTAAPDSIFAHSLMLRKTGNHAPFGSSV